MVRPPVWGNPNPPNPQNPPNQPNPPNPQNPPNQPGLSARQNAKEQLMAQIKAQKNEQRKRSRQKNEQRKRSRQRNKEVFGSVGAIINFNGTEYGYVNERNGEKVFRSTTNPRDCVIFKEDGTWVSVDTNLRLEWKAL